MKKKKDEIIFWGCTAAIFLGMGAIAGGLLVGIKALTITLCVLGGVLIAGGALVGFPHAFIENIEAIEQAKADDKEVVVEEFENEKQKEEEKIVVEDKTKDTNSKELDGREL